MRIPRSTNERPLCRAHKGGGTLSKQIALYPTG
jgi:hypothetical protein